MWKLAPLIGLLVAACTILYLSRNGILENFVFSEPMFGEQSNSQDTRLENFVDSPLTPYIQENQPYYNKAANLINPITPQLPLSASNSQNFIKATISPDYNSSMIPGTTKPLKIPSRQPEGVIIGQTICEKINTADCNAFDNPEFAANCGLALDVGTKSDGKAHTGGLYFDTMSRETQKLNVNVINGKDYNTYTPTIGTSKSFATDKDMCFRKQVDLKCKQSRVIGEGNNSATCSLCFTDGSYHATIPNSTVNPVTITLYTNANDTIDVSIASPDYQQAEEGSSFLGLFRRRGRGERGSKQRDQIMSGGKAVRPPVGTAKSNDNTTLSIYVTKPFTINEGDLLEIFCKNSSEQDVVIAGFIKASTPSNPNYQIDMTAFMNTDSYMPVLQNGTVDSYFIFIQQESQRFIHIRGTVPFTFTKPPNPDANNCSTGPFVTKAASMVALNADGDCYNSENSPGNYPLACLQKIFKGVGGTNKGTGYPTTANMGQLLRDANGNPRTLGQITDYLGGMAVQAATGLNNGVSMTLPNWNTVSLFMTGKAITNACETSGKGFISNECINFLYNDSATYGNSVSQNESLDSQDFQELLVCRPEGALSPSNPDGLQRAKTAAAKGGKDAVKQLYRTAFQIANNKSLSNKDRKQALKDCYGANVLNAKAEVFAVSNGSAIGYNVAYNDAPALCAKVGAVLATKDQLIAAQAAGSQSCRCGWTADDQISRYPMAQSGVPGCGSPGSGGLVKSVRVAGGADYLSISQLVIKDQNGNNVAPNGTTSSSGNWGAGSSERLAIDGTQAARPFPAEYHSNNKGAFFQVTLPQPTKLSSITIYNRSDCCQDRLVGYKVSLLDSNNTVLFTSGPLKADNVQTIPVNLSSSTLVECPKNVGWIGDKAAVYCYGPKPDQGSVPANIAVGNWSSILQTISAGWSSGNVINKWSQYS